MMEAAKIPEFCNRGYAEVNLDAIAENMENMKKHIAQETKLVGVLKADGYGHGSVPIAGVLEQQEFVWGYAVATAEEAHELRTAGMKKPILILGYTFPYCYEQLATEEIRAAVFREDTIGQLQAAAGRTGKKIRVHIKVDTGMSRIGITPDEAGLQFVEKLMQQSGIEIEGIFTHFARADELDKTDACGHHALRTLSVRGGQQDGCQPDSGAFPVQSCHLYQDDSCRSGGQLRRNLCGREGYACGDGATRLCGRLSEKPFG